MPGRPRQSWHRSLHSSHAFDDENTGELLTPGGPLKPDSAPVRGDLAYEPVSLRIQQSQRRDVAQRAGESWWLLRCRGQ